MPTTEVYTTNHDDFPITVSAQLVRLASARTAACAPDKGTDWRETADHWSVTIEEELYGGKMQIDYWSGIGNRVGIDRRPTEPSACDVLISIGRDIGTAENLPADDADAMDYLAEEFGHEGKPSELLRMVHALRQNRDKVRAMLKNTGIDPQHFADWCASLEVAR